jgi:Protein of unknown function (DUF5661)
MFTMDDARMVLDRLGLDLESEKITLEALTAGMNVELEHGSRFPDLNVSGDDPIVSAKIALAHLREIPDYYERLVRMEAEAETAMVYASDSDLGIM